MFQPWGSFKLYGISYYSLFQWFLLSFSHTRNMMPTFPWHTSYTICELLLSWNTSLRPGSAGVGHGEGWKTTAILQNQDFCLMYLYIIVGIKAVCRLAVVGSAGMYHARQTESNNWQSMAEGKGFLPPPPRYPSSRNRRRYSAISSGFYFAF